MKVNCLIIDSSTVSVVNKLDCSLFTAKRLISFGKDGEFISFILDKNFPRYPINLDFYACPKRFAETYHYVIDERLEIALENYRTKSAVRGDYTISQRFVDEVRRLCIEYQRGLTFKREVIGLGKDSEQEDSSFLDPGESSL